MGQPNTCPPFFKAGGTTVFVPHTFSNDTSYVIIIEIEPNLTKVHCVINILLLFLEFIYFFPYFISYTAIKNTD